MPSAGLELCDLLRRIRYVQYIKSGTGVPGIAGGPSLADFDFSFLEDKNVIAINNAFLKVASANVCYFSDLDWFERWKDQLKQHPGRKIRGHLPDKQINVDWVEEWSFTQERGLVLDPRCLAHGFNSGAAAINLAVQLGFRKLFLLGYDMQIVDGRTNFHSDHKRTTPQHAYTNQFMPSFEAMVQPLKKAGVEVFNATPGSALKLFPACSAILSDRSDSTASRQSKASQPKT